MYVGAIRPVETRTVEVEGSGLEEIAELVAAQTPENWQVTGTKVSMPKESSILRAEATLARRDGVSEIQGEDYAAILAAVPDGHQLLHVRTV